MTTNEVLVMERKIKEMIDQLKGLCSQNGLSNQAAEERIITSVFLYKFLNDKFFYNLSKFAEETGLTVEDILKNENDELDAFYEYNSQDVAFKMEDTIQTLVNKVNQPDFAKQFDEALVRISDNNLNERFSIETADGTRKPLFEPITVEVEASARNNFAKNIFSIIAQNKMDFTGAFEGNFDFYSAIFEYLIKDYNVASGVYAEYFTPASISSIIGKCLVGMNKAVKAAEIYDPSAGSGSLVLHLAHELGKSGDMNNAVIYTQDISNKSTRFLRLNLMLNGMSESLGNIIQGDTLLNPAHYEVENEPASGLKKFDYITSNPPFKMDFSSIRNAIDQKWGDTGRFFAGLPNIPNAKKNSMAIYTAFIQHIIYSLKPNGKAAIVVPTGFLTAQSRIEKTIREKLINEKMLKGAISMPSNIFANTGTNVSVLFIDKANTEGKVTLIDSSKLGEKVKDGKNQRTVLSQEEVNKIINTFVQQKQVDDFSVNVTYEEIKEKNYSFSAGQYFEIKNEYIEFTPEEFKTIIKSTINDLKQEQEKTILQINKLIELLEKIDYGGKMVWNEELKREIPEGWSVIRLSEICKINNNSIKPDKETKYRYYTIPDFDEKHHPSLEVGKNIKSNKFLLDKSCILVSKLNPQFPRIWPFEYSKQSQIQSICSTEFLPIVPDDKNLGFLYSVLSSASYSNFLNKNATSSTGSRKRVAPEIVLSYKLPYPKENNILEKYESIVDSILNLIKTYENATEETKELRDVLLPLLVNGQVTID